MATMAIHSLSPRKLMLVAAEASGDALGAGLIQALNQQAPAAFTFVGVGGARMREQGVRSPFDIAELSILGIAEGIKALPRVKRRVAEVVAFAQTEKPDAVVLIDSWGFTLRCAQAIRKAMPGVPLIKYVAPQVWAMRPGRARTLAGTVDFLLALHPMDPPFFEAHGLKTVVVGNPALNVDFSRADPLAFRKGLHIASGDPLVLVLPGSRPSEIRRLMPVFIEVMLDLARQRPGLTLAIPVAETVRAAVIAAADHMRVQQPGIRLHLIEDETEKRSAMQAADVALACSGTVSTELAMAGCPMVIAYKAEPLTYLIFKYVASIRHVTLFNIMADKRIAPEFLQQACTKENLLKAIIERLDNRALRDEQVAEQFRALDLMGRGQPPPAEKAAAALLAFLESKDF
jgi:lipid-A-disaccharide synthase